ncbi:MAG: polysaccharide biosynthesis tyrosine autokinase [Saprospiraceae bacterium]|nr:polysaccharide biosynthesis tyrosine autokinase [Saprospiraceae bacterium]
MKTNQVDRQTTSELNLREFMGRVWKYKFLYLLSLIFFAAIGVAYIKWVPPVYEVDTSILIDTKSNARAMSESQYVDGSLRLIETEKNLYNEMNILQSVDLIQHTLEDLNYQVSYHTKKNGIIHREHYKDFPFTVELVSKSNQLINTPVYLSFTTNDSYRVSVDADNYQVRNRISGKNELHEEALLFSKNHQFDKAAETDLYTIIVHRNEDIPLSDYEGEELYFIIHDMDDLVRSYQNRLSVSQTEVQASIINLTCQGEVVQKETDFLDRLTENYIYDKLEERNQIANSKINFIEQQLANISDSLHRAERSLERFKQTADAVNLTQTGANALAEYQDLESRSSQSEMNLNYYKSLLSYVQDSTGNSQVVAPSVVGIEDALLNENLLELKRLNSDLSRIQFLQGEKSPDAEVIKHQIESTRASLEENLKSLISSTTLALSNLGRRKGQIEQTIDMLPTREKNLINYQRKTKLFENLYNYLSQELAKTNIAQAEDLSDIRVINHARMVGDDAKVPQKELIMALALLLGLLLPSLFIYTRGESDGSIDGINMVEDITSIPVLAQIATDPKLKKKDTILSDHWQTKESIRDLHANIKFFLPNYWKKVIAVTSNVPGEGKSFVASNLAMTMASAGNSVLLIDADFRNPTTSRHLGVNPNKNLSTYLNGWIDSTDEIIQTHEKYRKLDYITTTAASTNPHRYIQNPRFEFMLIGLKDEYDHIIIDCPAVGLVSDYLLLFHLADIHLFVMKHKFTKRSHLEEIEKFKAKRNVENLYLVLNGVPGKKLKHGYFTYDSSIDQGGPGIVGQGQNGTDKSVVNVDSIKSN